VRVLQVYRDHFSLVPGGIERHVSDLASGLSDRVESVIVAGARSRTPRVSVDAGVRVHLVAEYGRLLGAPIAPGLIRAIRDDGFDLVHIHSPNPTAELGALTARRRAKVIATYHADSDRGGMLRPVYERALARALNRCATVIATTDSYVKSSPVLQRVRSQIDVIPLGVDVAAFSPGSERTPNDPPVVLFVGRLRYYKGLDVLLEAARALEVQVVIAGDGPERDRLERLARTTVGERGRFLGAVDDDELPALYRSADVVCLPSTTRAEAFGLSVVEAMACGVPVVTTELGTGTSVVNRHLETGLVVPPGDPHALAGVLHRMTSDRNLNARLGVGARTRAQSEYDRVQMLDRIYSVYERVLRGPRS
jgi:glycosyltransferase involved in cell wall biosynthesis